MRRFVVPHRPGSERFATIALPFIVRLGPLRDDEPLAMRIRDPRSAHRRQRARAPGRQLYAEPRGAASVCASCYLGDEGSPLTASPPSPCLYLAHPRLKALEAPPDDGGRRRHSRSGARSSSRTSVATPSTTLLGSPDAASGVRFFGSPDVDYEPETYQRPRPGVAEASYVTCPTGTAQAHPDEDFAETLAVWLGGAAEEFFWRYRGVEGAREAGVRRRADARGGAQAAPS